MLLCVHVHACVHVYMCVYPCVCVYTHVSLAPVSILLCAISLGQIERPDILSFFPGVMEELTMGC